MSDNVHYLNTLPPHVTFAHLRAWAEIACDENRRLNVRIMHTDMLIENALNEQVLAAWEKHRDHLMQLAVLAVREQIQINVFPTHPQPAGYQT